MKWYIGICVVFFSIALSTVIRARRSEFPRGCASATAEIILFSMVAAGLYLIFWG